MRWGKALAGRVTAGLRAVSKVKVLDARQRPLAPSHRSGLQRFQLVTRRTLTGTVASGQAGDRRSRSTPTCHGRAPPAPWRTSGRPSRGPAARSGGDGPDVLLSVVVRAPQCRCPRAAERRAGHRRRVAVVHFGNVDVAGMAVRSLPPCANALGREDGRGDERASDAFAICRYSLASFSVGLMLCRRRSSHSEVGHQA